MRTIPITDEMVRRAMEASGWSPSCDASAFAAAECTMRAALEAAMNPPKDFTTTHEQRIAGLQWIENNKLQNGMSHADLDSIYAAMRALEPKPHLQKWNECRHEFGMHAPLSVIVCKLCGESFKVYGAAKTYATCVDAMRVERCTLGDRCCMATGIVPAQAWIAPDRHRRRKGDMK